jgi:uncharacterized coiled-coil protein SlyX
MFNTPQEQEVEQVENTTSPDSPQDQGNWEARAKGFQRALAGKEGYLKTLQANFNDLKGQLDSEVVAHQGEVAQLKAQLDEVTRKVAQFEAENKSLQTESSSLKRDQEIRKFMAKGYSDLVPWYDSEYLQVGELTGDELKAHLDGFRSMLTDKATTEVRNTLRGATPPVSVPSGKTDELSTDDLADWLMDPANDSNPERAKYQELYFSQLG